MSVQPPRAARPLDTMRSMRRIAWIGSGLVGLGLLSQGIVWQHARAMTTFVADGPRTAPPEALSFAGKVRTLVFGVNIPRPVASETPADHGLTATERRIPGGAGQLSLLVFEGGEQVIVVVHGYAAERSQLFPTVARLLDLGYTVVAPDLRGVGGVRRTHHDPGLRRGRRRLRRRGLLRRDPRGPAAGAVWLLDGGRGGDRSGGPPAGPG